MLVALWSETGRKPADHRTVATKLRNGVPRSGRESPSAPSPTGRSRSQASHLLTGTVLKCIEPGAV